MSSTVSYQDAPDSIGPKCLRRFLFTDQDLLNVCTAYLLYLLWGHMTIGVCLATPQPLLYRIKTIRVFSGNHPAIIRPTLKMPLGFVGPLSSLLGPSKTIKVFSGKPPAIAVQK